MPNPPGRPPEDDIDALFDDPPPARPASRPAAGGSIPLGESYDVEGEDPADEPAPIPRAPIAPKKKPRPREEVEDDSPREPEPEARVDEVWTRWGEWGPTLIVLLSVAAAVVVVAYILASSGSFGPAFLVFALGGVAMILLSYPIAVTLERPVRMTPEQALKDFTAPRRTITRNFARMWLLLSASGKASREFSDFGEFRAYWQGRLKELRGDRVKSSTPLAFEVGEFRGDKSGGKTSVDVKYTLNVRPRGESTEPLASVKISTSLVRGPDKMWYLNSGLVPMPSAEPAKKSRSEPSSWDG